MGPPERRGAAAEPVRLRRGGGGPCRAGRPRARCSGCSATGLPLRFDLSTRHRADGDRDDALALRSSAAAAPAAATTPERGSMYCSNGPHLGATPTSPTGPAGDPGGALAVLAAVLFGVLLFRLWALQVLRTEALRAAGAARTTSRRSRCRRRAAGSRTPTAGSWSTTRAASGPGQPGRSLEPTSTARLQRHRGHSCQAAMAQLPVGAAPRCVAFPAQHRCKELGRLGRISA